MRMNETCTHCTCAGVVAASDIDVNDVEHEYLTGSDGLGVSASCANNRGEGVDWAWRNKGTTQMGNTWLTAEWTSLNLNDWR